MVWVNQKIFAPSLKWCDERPGECKRKGIEWNESHFPNCIWFRWSIGTKKVETNTHTHTQIEGNEHDQAFQWHIYTKTFEQMEMNEFGFASSRYGVSGWHIWKRQPKPNWITSQITAIIYFDFLCQMSSSAIFFSLQNIRYFLLVSSLVSSFSRGRYKYIQWICVCAESNIFLFVVGCYRFVASQWQ